MVYSISHILCICTSCIAYIVQCNCAYQDVWFSQPLYSCQPSGACWRGSVEESYLSSLTTSFEFWQPLNTSHEEVHCLSVAKAHGKLRVQLTWTFAGHCVDTYRSISPFSPVGTAIVLCVSMYICLWAPEPISSSPSKTWGASATGSAPSTGNW